MPYKDKEEKRAYMKAYHQKNKEKMRAAKKIYYQKHKEEISAYNTINKEEKSAYNKAYHVANRERILTCKKVYGARNKDKIRIKHRCYQNNKLKTDIQFKLRLSLRNRLRAAIRNKQKAGSAIRDLGCTVDELKVHLEKQFQEGMTWDNWSYIGWHIDHRQPLSLFDLTDSKQSKVACHYTNLQPLWAEENFAKSNKIQEVVM